MAPWAPDPAGVEQILQLFREYLQPGANQQLTLSRLQECSKFPDFNNYLAYILSQYTGPVAVRMSAGLQLKNNFKAGAYNSLLPEYQTLIKSLLLPCVGHPDKLIRKTVAAIVVGLVATAPGGLAEWPELLGALVACLDAGGDVGMQEAGLACLFMLCEDAPALMDAPVPGAAAAMGGAAGASATPAELLVPRLLALMRSPAAGCRFEAVGCLNQLLGYPPAPLLASLEGYTQGLFAAAVDSSSAVQRRACAGLVGLMATSPGQLEAQLGQVCEYMLAANQSPEPELALEAAEFWGALCESELPLEGVRGMLARLVPVLLQNMAYAEDDDEVLEVEAAEAAGGGPEKPSEVKPFLASGRAHDVGEEGADGEGGEDDDEDDEAVGSWTLRKCSASALDTLSTVFGDDILPHMLPAVQDALGSADWRRREAAILALGAVAKGCSAGLTPYLPQIVTVLLPGLEPSGHPLVRSISCWSLSRFARWLAEADASQFAGVLEGLLRRVGDPNRRVQEAACSAVASLAEEAGEVMLPWAGPTLQCLGAALASYSPRNLRLAYDALGTLSEALGSHLAAPELSSLLLPPLMARWTALSDADRELPPLLECLTAVCRALGASFAPYAPAVLSRCLSVLSAQAAARHAEADGYEKELVVAALDLMGGLAEGLGASMQPLLATPAASAQLLALIEDSAADPAPDVRQSALALLGDLARASHAVLLPRLGPLLQLCSQNLAADMLTPENFSASNNAAWALGELALVVPPEHLAPAAPALAQVLVQILGPVGQASNLHRGLMENAAISLGRLGWRAPAPLAPHLPHFLADWCLALRRIRDELEKEQAFLGLSELLRANMSAVLAPGAFMPLCAAIGSWRNIAHAGLRSQLGALLASLQAQLGPRWATEWGGLDDPLRNKLAQMYGL